MLAAALIVFRETLEAAMFVGIIAAATRQLTGRARWLGAGVGAGVLGALALALVAESLASWNDGTGQDLANIGILSVALAMLIWHCVSGAAQGQQMSADARALGASVKQGERPPWALFIATALAVLREGAETVLFVGGSITAQSSHDAAAVLLSCALGLAAGVGVGLFIYLGLSRIPLRRLFAVTQLLIALLAASIASQLAKALAQAGLVERWSTPLWDSSAWIAPDSALGTTMHALFGYDAHPSALQLAFYVAVALIIFGGARLMQANRTAP